MPSFADLDALARALPEVEVRFSTDDRPEYRVRGKLFACLRGRRQDALDPATGGPLDDVVMLRTPGLIAKATLLADPDLPLFTTSHFDGWPAVLIRARDLDRVAAERLEALVEGAWAAQAPKRLVAARAAERAGT
jgi:hypothetical protein